MHSHRAEERNDGLPFFFLLNGSIRSSLSGRPRVLIDFGFMMYLSQVEEIQYVGFLSKLLEKKILELLRFKHGQVWVSHRFNFFCILWPIFLS